MCAREADKQLTPNSCARDIPSRDIPSLLGWQRSMPMSEDSEVVLETRVKRNLREGEDIFTDVS